MGDPSAKTFFGVAHKLTGTSAVPPETGPPSQCSLMGDPSAKTFFGVAQCSLSGFPG
jgi:hypothetical protein